VTGSGTARGRRRALLLACAEYDDPTIPRLRSPERDAAELAAVLSDETRGRYEVRTEVNSTVDEARVAIEQFLTDGRRDDLLLVYFSCHGILDARNELHLAFRNTRQNLLQATGLSREWVHARLNEARPQSSVVLVDCCFSGAFVHGGLRSRAARRPVDVEGLVRDPPPGKARAVLTASTATQLSFEDDVSRAEAAARPSYFTEAVIAALRTGAADRDRDGRISVDDLYSFVYDRVTRAGHGQEPQRAIYGAGELVIAYAGQHEPEPPLPPEPPDSDLTLVIEPDMPLAPWPPLPGDAAAPRRAQDHAAFHTSPQQPPRPPQPYVAPPDPTEPVSAPSRWQLRPLSWSMLALGLALVLLAGFALWGLLRPRPATRVPTPAVSPTMPRNLEDGIADFGTSFVATGQEGPFDLNTLARFFGRDAERYRSALKESGLRRGYARTLRSSDGELLGIVLMELGSPPAAQAVQQWFGVCGDRPATDFDVPAIPGAIARACVGDAGRAVQEVIFTRGLLLYKVKLDRIREPRLTGQIVELAGVQAKKAGH